MITVSQNQALDRWDTVPDVLREALSSEQNSDFVWNTAESEHLPDDKVATVSKLVGYVLLGFLHPGDLVREFQAIPGVNSEIATRLSGEFEKRIFTSLTQELDNVYAPPEKEGITKVLDIEVPRSGITPEKGIPAPAPLPVVTPRKETTLASPPKPGVKDQPFNRAPLDRARGKQEPTAASSTSTPFMMHMKSKVEPVKPKGGFRLKLGKGLFGKAPKKVSGIKGQVSRVKNRVSSVWF